LIEIKKYQNCSALVERADALDVELAGFRTTIEDLSGQIDLVYADIDKRSFFCQITYTN
jgi:predicted O-methyltransferase YrrM